MKSLQTIQKTFRVFGTLSKVAMILSFIWAGTLAIGLLCGIAWYTGGNVFGLGSEQMLGLTNTTSFMEMIGALLADFILALTDGILFLFALRYFKAEQADGTPFTMSGAEQIKRLGIQMLVMPLVALCIGRTVYKIFHVTARTDQGYGASFILGIVLILASLVFRYGAELEEKRNHE